jgi:hypothetical protein
MSLIAKAKKENFSLLFLDKIRNGNEANQRCTYVLRVWYFTSPSAYQQDWLWRLGKI